LRHPQAKLSIRYAASGWPIFPVAGKRPLTERGLKEACNGTAGSSAATARTSSKFPDARARLKRP